MANRTFRLATYQGRYTPLGDLLARRAGIAQRLGEPRRALLGDGSGQINVPNTNLDTDESGMGYVWCRWPEFSDINQGTQISGGEAFKVRVNDAQYPEVDNLEVWVGLDFEGELALQSATWTGMVRSGIDPRGLNAASPRQRQLWVRHINDGKPFLPSTESHNSTRVGVQGFFYYFDGSLNFAQHTRHWNNDLDLSPFVPGAGTLAVVGLWHNAAKGTLYANTGTLAAAPYIYDRSGKIAPNIFTDLATADVPDYSDPLGAFVVDANGSDYRSDTLTAEFRNIVHHREPRGMPYRIQRHIHVTGSYQEQLFGMSETIDNGGQLQIDNGGQFYVKVA